ncbi:serine-rich adhesin for platelets-like [Hylaeus anthracinus]|uniref:serine-rich adhesin for platelets-like n=1 Tax=Hylaeus anthracinus TaxID=313031 RepID=UPI0023B94E48|nr:serine-rich adhesin for platelets-like [Hylaeus anthracinus]
MAEEDCNDADYLGAYSRFFTEFIARVNPYDQLPVPVSSYNVTDDELIGEIINVTLQYINQTPCPSSLQAHLVHQVIQEILSMCKKQPEDYGYKPQENTYTSLKLMQAVTGKVNEICTRYLDNSRLALLPSPPSTPLPQVIAGGNKNCRRRMEDRYVVIHDLHTMFGIEDDSVANYYAVFDGHGGQDAAVYSATHLHQYLAESIYYPTDPERALREAFIETDTQFIEKSKTQKICGGTTAVCTLLLNKKLYVAWVGDSSAMLIKRDSVVQLVNPHRLQRKDEVRRIQKMGGVVMESMGIMRVNGVLSVSRAIGDVRYKPFVTGEPEVKCVHLDGTEDFLVVATDGLTDYLNSSEVLTVLYHEIQRDPSGLKRAHRILLRWAKREGSKDNITLVVVLLTPASEIAARPPNAHPFRCMKTNDILENMNSKDKPLFLDMDDAHNAINSNILKQTMLSQETRDRDDGILAASNGKHENGDADYDYSDLGPETDVDAVDDVSVPVENDSNHEKDSNLLDNLRIEQPEINAKRQLDAENNLREDEDEDRDDDDKVLDKYPASESVLEAAPRRISTNHPSAVFKLGENYEDYYGMERFVDYDDFPPSSDANRPLQPALVPGADNVADSEDSEDEWNYYPNKEKDPVDEPQEVKTEGEIESPELPIEDNELKIQSEDIGEGIKCETPKEEQSQLINTEISAESGAVESDQEEKLFAKEQEESKNMDFPLNPDAAEFVPVSPQFRGPRMNLSNDYPISGSPLKQVPQMDDIQVPSQSEFEEEVCQRPREVEPEEREYQNGVNSQPTDDADFINDRPKVHGFGANLDDSEISSMKAEFGDESSTSFLTATDFHRTGVSTVDESFSSSERDYDIAKDPMAMSFTPSDFEAAFDKAVDLNAVHNLSNTDLDDKNGMIEEEGFTAQSPEPHPELTTLASPEAEQPTHTPAFPGESAELVNLSSQQEDSEATFIEHTDETKANVDFLNLQSESSQLDQQETARSDHSPLTENYSAEFESEKEAVSIDNEPILTPSSIEIDETKPMDETSEDAVPLEACSRQEVSVKEADTPASISPVPEAMETDVLAPAENTEVSSQLLSALDADAPKFTPGHYTFSPTESNDVCKPSLAKTNDVCEPPHIETSNICESSPLETGNICESSPLETSNIICESSPVETSEISKPTNTEISNVCESSSVQASDVCQSYLVDSSNDFQPSFVETSKVDQSPLIEESNVDQSPFVETTNIYQSSLVDTYNDEVCEFSSIKSSNVCEPVSHNLVFGMQPPEEKAVESIPTQSGQDNLLDFAEEEEVCVKKVVEVESTPPPSPQNSEEKVSQNVDDMICSIKSALEQKVDDVVESKEEAPVDADIFEFKTHVTEEPMKADVLNLSESMAELRLSSLKSELLTKSEDTLVSSFDQQLQEEVPQKEELIAAREPEQPSAPEAEEYKIEAETKVEEVSSAIKEPPVEKAAEVSGNKVAKAAAVTAVAAGVVAGAVVAQSKTKTKPIAAKPSKTTATKTAQKSTPTSPSKTITATTRTSTAAAKKPTTTRPKDLDAAKKTTVSSTTSSKVPATKPAPKTTSATSVTKSATRPNTGSVAAKAKPTSTTAKTTVSDKKPTANGDIKSLNKVDTATAKPPISKTTSVPKAASAKTTTARMLTATTTTTSTKTRPASAVAATKSATTTTKTSMSATTTSTLSSRPKSTSTAGKVTKSRVLTPKSSPIIDKQVKETANKQISMARSSTVTKTTRVSTSNTTTTTAKRASMTAKTTSTASPIKKLTATSKISNRTSTPGKTTTQKEKVVQNGVSEKVEMNAIIDDVPKKDLSPVVTPNDNQLIMSSD